MPATDTEETSAPDNVLVHKGERYFCSHCNHLMTKVRDCCPVCNCTFAGVIDEEERIPADPARLREIDEDYAAQKQRHFFRAAIITMLLIGAIALLVYFLAFRR